MSGVLAASVDGRSFTTSAGEGAPTGTLVRLETPEGAWLGLIEAVSPDGAEVGRVLGVLDGDGGLDQRSDAPFRDAHVRPADAASVDALHRASRATLDIGTMLASPGPAKLIGSRFNRHTFWCGQSGSGKTYALGVVLEQVLAHTALPIVVFDPNSDFVRLGELREGVTGEDAAALASRDIRVLRPNGPDPLLVHFRSLPIEAKAAILRLDPVADAREFNTLLHSDEVATALDKDSLLGELRASEDPGRQALATRIDNLGMLDWELWAGERTPVTDIIAGRPDATVLDLGGFSTPDQHLSVAISVLDDLWARRAERRPVLLVIDEAHNLCSPDLVTPLAVAVRERIIQIAAEGRKYGLWLLLSTQRPSKIHPGIISQCDNLAVMKMSSPGDLAQLGSYFGVAPAGLLAMSPWFRQGEALFAGGFVPAPTLVKMGTRLTPEGGSDVGVPMR
ncbi:ATP-binding protein [Agromyces aurantiacus]|uniref:ATP-binding protein n=1 Tax=Agromyces aurantiacus TaxID=165814 RepID=A0ABV9R8S7_9MICO|nr:ATP-binding protein [Agromyces aurantiacus]MBM7503425.1 DNA helicase HerA-like ATPase [Agromyces aurantiacus]